LGSEEIPIDVAIFFAGSDFPQDSPKLVNMRGGSDVDASSGLNDFDSSAVVLGWAVGTSRVSISNWPVGPETSFPSFISAPGTRMEMITSVGSPEDIALRLEVMRGHEW
jgi:hypothetical protein